MRIGLLAALFAAVATPAIACNDQLFTVTDWRANATGDGQNLRTVVEAELRYEGDRPYRMIHAAVMFSDVMGNALFSPAVERDATVLPGEELKVSGAFRDRASRITTINRDDVTSRVCVWSIVYDDGTVETF